MASLGPLDLAGIAAVSVLSFALFLVVGAVLGLLPRPHGLLRKENVKFMADLTFLALVPCFLVVSLGKGTNGKVLLESVSLLLWSGIQLLVGLLLGGYAFERVAKPERHFAVAFKLAATFGNQGSLPLLLLSSLMRSAAFADDPTAYQRSAVYVFVYGIVWSIALWGVGRQIAARDPHKSGAGEAGAGEQQGAIVVVGAGRGGGGGFLGAPAALERCWAPVLDALEAARERWEEWEADERWGGAAQSLRECGKAMRAGLLTPPVVAIAIGILVGLTPLQGALFERGGSLLPVGDVVATLGAAAIPMSNLVLAGSLFHGLRDAYERFQRRRSERSGGDEERGLRNGGAGNASGDMEMEVEMESSSSSVTSAVASSSSASSFAGVTPTANVPSSSSTTSSSTTSPPSPASPTSSSSSDEAAPAQAGESISVRTIALMCVARLVLVSGVNVGLYWLASWAKVPVLAPGAALDPVMRMVILVEACMPSGQFNLLILQTTGNQKAAQDLSSAYLIMYPLSLISIAGWLTLANYIVLQWEPSRV